MPFPDWVDPALVTVLGDRGVTELYTHQHEAVEAVRRGEHVAVVTPTASGKTLCYNLPVLNTILEDPSARALYLFPTKALAQDQLANIHTVATASTATSRPTPTTAIPRPTPASSDRTAGHIVISNPDMLHTGVLPHHTKWVRLFENLRYVVIDELHNYRGVFGSHVANVMRRLLRICEFYGSKPQFICSSATIANPKELAEKMVGVAPIRLVDDNGAPQGPKTFVFYNPPLVNRELGLRRSSLLEGTDLASQLLANDIQTIVFARTRASTEILLTYLQEAAARSSRIDNPKSKIRGYRGGYLPNQRREIERGLRDGTVRTVVSTNALELGIDIGALEAAVLVGYPGTVASTWQQAGRAGRRQEQSLAMLVASSSPLDQFLVKQPAILLRAAARKRVDKSRQLLYTDEPFAVRGVRATLPRRRGVRHALARRDGRDARLPRRAHGGEARGRDVALVERELPGGEHIAAYCGHRELRYRGRRPTRRRASSGRWTASRC